MRSGCVKSGCVREWVCEGVGDMEGVEKSLRS